MQNLEDSRNLKITKKANIDAIEEEINDIRKKITTLQKELSSAQKQQAAIESKIDQKRSDKHGLFRVIRVCFNYFPFQKQVRVEWLIHRLGASG